MHYDYLIVGGGLQGGLLALALRDYRPDASVALVEREGRLGGNHTWSFHAQDVPPAMRSVIDPLVVARWPGYTVRFPGWHKYLHEPYATITSERLDLVLRHTLTGSSSCTLLLNEDIREMGSHHVYLKDGTKWTGRHVFDARGSTDIPEASGFQKFVGLEVEIDRDWPERDPTVMDAEVSQDDGYRFMYVLPFTPRRILVEDTYFSDSAHLHPDRLRKRVEMYLKERGIAITRIVRTESGVLPMPWSAANLPAMTEPMRVGMAGGWFHAATGYSFPLAVRVAQTIAMNTPEMATEAVGHLARRHRLRGRFARFLNFLLFRLVDPKMRWAVFRRFFRKLPDASVSRFFAHEFTMLDAARVVIGWPPPGLRPFRPFQTISRGTVPCPS